MPAQSVSRTAGDGLAGVWRKTATDECARSYPAELKFGANGLYTGVAAVPGAYAVWDQGTWRVTRAGRVALSTANDAVIEYGFVLAGGNLEFHEAGGCTFTYQRVS